MADGPGVVEVRDARVGDAYEGSSLVGDGEGHDGARGDSMGDTAGLDKVFRLDCIDCNRRGGDGRVRKGVVGHWTVDGNCDCSTVGDHRLQPPVQGGHRARQTGPREST